MRQAMEYAYAVGYEDGIKACDKCISRERLKAFPKFEDLDQQMQYADGIVDGYDYAEENDCTTNLILPDIDD